MKHLRLLVSLACVLFGWGLLHAQKPFRQYQDTIEHNNFPLPADWDRPAEWVFARLKYPDVGRFQNGLDLYWTMDYPAGDRHLIEGIRRLTRLNVRGVEQVVELDGSDDVYNWPFLYGVEVGMWEPTVEQAEQLRDFIDRGGFLMVDDFHGTYEWDQFMYAMGLVFPDRDISGAVIDLNVGDPVFNVFSSVDKLEQVPSAQYMYSGVTYEKGGITPHFRGIADSEGRLMVVINHNMDLGDAIEWSDDPQYPEEFAALAYRTVTNYVIYNLTH